MNRTGLVVALAAAVVTGVAFAVFPELDIAIARLFYAAESRFHLDANAWLVLVREASMWIVTALVAPAVVALLLKLARPDRPMFLPARAAVFLIATVVLGPILAVNAGLKEHWSRPRPHQIVQFGGSAAFVPWWDPRGNCTENCSFVAGEASGAAWTLAPAALAPPQWRTLAYAGALGFTALIGGLRMAFGGHFFSDVIFAIVIVFLIVWLVHGALYRWRMRPSDAAIESVVARMGYALRAPFRRPAPVRRGQEAARPRSESYSPVQKEPP